MSNLTGGDVRDQVVLSVVGAVVGAVTWWLTDKALREADRRLEERSRARVAGLHRDTEEE